MKPLNSVQITRDNKGYCEWEDSAHHLTDDGRAAFRERQRARIAVAEKARQASNAETSAKVKPIKRRQA